jgi:predicted transcriptional regulator
VPLLTSDNQIMLLRELAKGPVKNLPRGLHGEDMDYLVKAGCVVETLEDGNKASYEITVAGRAALKESDGER